MRSRLRVLKPMKRPSDGAGKLRGMSRKAMADIGGRIRSLRMRLDRSEPGFAALLGVEPELVAAWEAGERIDRDALILIAGATDTEMEWLIAGLTPAEVESFHAAARADRRRSRRPDQAVRDDGLVRPRLIMADEPPPPSIAAAWDVQPESGAPAARRRPSALLLDLPGATLVAGRRAAAYRVRPASGLEQVQLKLVLQGRHRFEGPRGRCTIGRGGALFTSSADAGLAAYAPAGRYVSVFLPAASLATRAPRFAARLMTPIAAGSPPLRLIGAYVSSLMLSEDGLDPETARSLAEHFVDLCAILLGAEGDDRALAEARGLRAAQRTAAAQAIEAGATTPGFSAAALALSLGVTEGQLHELFLETGEGFWDRVDARRLDIARARLVDPEFDPMTVAELAFACGFSSLGEFTRLFTARFGVDPADFRRRR